MKKSRFAETQIVKAIKAHESGRKVEDIRGDLGVSTIALYK
jgi:putative transposase